MSGKVAAALAIIVSLISGSQQLQAQQAPWKTVSHEGEEARPLGEREKAPEPPVDPDASPAQRLRTQVRRQAAELAELRKQLDELEEKSSATARQARQAAADAAAAKETKEPKTRTETDDCGEGKTFQEVDVFAERLLQADCGDEPNTSPVQVRFLADYNKGFLIRPVDKARDPWRLRINSWIQFRHIGFTRDRDQWTDNAGVTRRIENRNNFDTERARLVFSGFAIDERMTYFLQLDGDTDGREGVDFFDYWWAWKFSDKLRVQVGKRKVPTSQQWLLGARDTRFIDRPIATDFFRPDRTVGIFANGELAEGLFYQAMLGNGYRTANLNAGEINDDFALAAAGYWEPAGPFGNALTDHEMHEDPVIRVGHSGTWSSQQGRTAAGAAIRETNFVRLGDGTRLVDTGALAPGVRISKFDVYLYVVDAAIKVQGWSLNAEAYFRWLQNLSGDGALPQSKIFQRGFFVEAGRVLVPKKLDMNVRYSRVSDDFGDGFEYGSGVNWYPLDTKNVKISFDALQLNDSPLNNTASEILVGNSGILFRSQVQIEF